MRKKSFTREMKDDDKPGKKDSKMNLAEKENILIPFIEFLRTEKLPACPSKNSKDLCCHSFIEEEISGEKTFFLSILLWQFVKVYNFRSQKFMSADAVNFCNAAAIPDCRQWKRGIDEGNGSEIPEHLFWSANCDDISLGGRERKTKLCTNYKLM